MENNNRTIFANNYRLATEEMLTALASVNPKPGCSLASAYANNALQAAFGTQETLLASSLLSSIITIAR